MEVSSHISHTIPTDPRIPIRSPDRSDDGNDSKMNVAQSNPFPQSTTAFTVEQTIQNTRARLEQHLKQNATSTEETLQLAMDVVNIPCPLGMKYARVDIPKLLKDNYTLQGPNTLPVLKSALGILSKYGGNLLRENRPSVWRCVRFSNEIFRNKVDNVAGSRAMLKLLGYTQEIEDGLAYPDDVEEPDINEVMKISADILIAKCEVDAVMNNTHQNPDTVKQYLGGPNQVKSTQDFLNARPKFTPKKCIVNRGVALPGMVSGKIQLKTTTPSSVSVKPSLSSPANQKQPEMISQSLATDAPTGLSPNSSTSSYEKAPVIKRPESLPVQPPKPSILTDSQLTQPKYIPISPPSVPEDIISEQRFAPVISSATMPKREPKPKKIDEAQLCDLCGKDTATKACDTCGDKRCANCDELWHKHPVRKDHQRNDIIPEVSSPGSDENFILGKTDDCVFRDTQRPTITHSRSDVGLASDNKPIPAPRQRIKTDPMSKTSPLSPGDRSQTLPRTQSMHDYPSVVRRTQSLRKPTPPPKPDRPLSVGIFNDKTSTNLKTPPKTSPGSVPMLYQSYSPDFNSPQKNYQSPGEVILSSDEEKRLTLTREIRDVDIEMTRKKIEQIIRQRTELERNNQFATQTPFYHELGQRLEAEKDNLEILIQEKQKIDFTLSAHQYNQRNSYAGQPQFSLPPTVKLPPSPSYSPYMDNYSPYMDRQIQPLPWMTGSPATMHNIPSHGQQQFSPDQGPSYGFPGHDFRRYESTAPSRVQSGICHECRYLNMAGSTVCRNCNSSLLSSEPAANKLQKDVTQIEIQPKECTGCGMLNKAESNNCVACLKPLISTPSYNEVLRDQGFPPRVNTMASTTSRPQTYQPPQDQIKSPPTKTDVMGKKQAWACEHCTFLNTDPNTRICTMCDKTTTSIPLKKKPELKPKPVLGNGKIVTDSQTKVQSPVAGADATSPGTDQKVSSRFVSMQEEQEQVLIEKLQAKKEWEEQLKREREEEEKLKEAGLFPRKQPTLTEEVAKPTVTEKPAIQPKKLDVSKWEQQQIQALEAEREQHRRSRQKQDAAAEHLREKKLQEEQRTDGLKFINLLREVEDQAFCTEELEIAMHLCNNGNPLKWLKEDWVHRIETVVAMVAHEQGKDTTLQVKGEISLTESKEALLRNQGDVGRAVQECKTQRNEKIDEIAKFGDYSKDEVAEALKQNKGDVEEALIDLNKRILQPYFERLWKSEEFDVTQTIICQAGADMERRVRMVLARYNMPSWGRAETAIRLIDFGKYEPEDAIIAAKECGTADRAMEFLEKSCEICYETVPMNKLHTLFHCQCKICLDCMVNYFKIQIREKNIRQCTCPVCDMPDMEDQETADQYFQFLDTMVKYFLDEETHTLFQQKLRDLYLMQDPNFRWCSHCDFGFLNDRPDRLKMRCPECHEHTCFKCKKHWLDQHEGITCENFQKWKEENDPDHQAAGLAAHLQENGIDCPNCKFRYALAKGGCMHFRCTQCRHEFCSGCNMPFKTKCNRFKSCGKKGLHAHHPRNCLFYLRDVDIKDLQKLLQDNNVKFDTVAPKPGVVRADNQEEEGAAARLPAEGKCRVEEQKETTEGLKDDFCGRDAEQGFAGLCKLHYSEYLVELIKANHIDPAVMLDSDALRVILLRNEIKVPERQKKESVAQYTHKLLEIIQQRLPLEERN